MWENPKNSISNQKIETITAGYAGFLIMVMREQNKGGCLHSLCMFIQFSITSMLADILCGFDCAYNLWSAYLTIYI